MLIFNNLLIQGHTGYYPEARYFPSAEKLHEKTPELWALSSALLCTETFSDGRREGGRGREGGREGERGREGGSE